MWGGWGGNGFGRGNQAETNSDFARLAAMGNQNNNPYGCNGGFTGYGYGYGYGDSCCA